MVAVVSRAPLISEALASVLEGIARVSWFPAGKGDTAGLLRSLEPQAIVVDSADEAREAEPVARESHALLVHLLLTEGRMRLLTGASWEDEDEDSPEAIRNAIVGSLYGSVAK